MEIAFSTACLVDLARRFPENIEDVNESQIQVRMRTFACVLIVWLVAIGGEPACRADLVFRLAQSSPSGEIPFGSLNAATFSVFVSSTVDNQSLSGIDMTISLSSANGAGGRMVAGTNDLLPVSSNPAGWFAGSFDAPGSTEASYSTSVAPAITLPAANVESLVATVTLSTVGAAPGNYTVSLKDILALDNAFLEIPVSPSNPSLVYTISTVPEPSAMAMAGVALAGFGCSLRRRRA